MIGDPRVAPRKVLRCRGKVQAQGGPVLEVRAIDISTGGACLMVPEQIHTGHLCLVVLDVPLRGVMCKIKVTAKVAYSICGSDGFKTGFQFIDIDPPSSKTISEIMMS